MTIGARDRSGNKERGTFFQSFGQFAERPEFALIDEAREANRQAFKVFNVVLFVA
jgi:hypothetical protein